jgi:hypothetical protein
MFERPNSKKKTIKTMKRTLKTTGIGLARRLEKKKLRFQIVDFFDSHLYAAPKWVRGEVEEGEFVLIEPIIWSEHCPLALMEFFDSPRLKAAYCVSPGQLINCFIGSLLTETT